jgi:Flp pilus assembly protein TadG
VNPSDGIEQMARKPRKCRDERGTITVVTIGFMVVLGLIIVVVVNASVAFLEHRKLTNLADSIALHAADTLDLEYYHANSGPNPVRIDAAQATAEATARLPADTNLEMRVENENVYVRLERDVTLWIVPGLRPQAHIVAEVNAALTLMP